MAALESMVEMGPSHILPYLVEDYKVGERIYNFVLPFVLFYMICTYDILYISEFI